MPRTRPERTNPVPSISEPVIDRYRRWQPTWYRWIEPLLSQTRETVARVEAVDQNASAAVTEEKNARTTADSALSLRIEGVESTVGDNTLDITEVTKSVDGIKGQWGVSVNANGRVIGAIKLEALVGATTAFSVLANKFEVVHPANNNLTQTVFATGNVNGVATVGINGDLLIDGSVSARHITATSLSAINANLGTITAGRLQDAPTATAPNGTYFIDLTQGRIGTTSGSISLDLKNSQFSILANKFEVVHPTNSALRQTVFAIGNVNGVATVGINGNLLIDGSVLARHITATSLSAINANLGTITAGRLQDAPTTTAPNGTYFIDLIQGRIGTTSGSILLDLKNPRLRIGFP